MAVSLLKDAPTSTFASRMAAKDVPETIISEFTGHPANFTTVIIDGTPVQAEVIGFVGMQDGVLSFLL